jgi:heme A synthase
MALIFGLGAIPLDRSDRRGRALRLVVATLAGVQMLLGFVNVWLAAPVWLQLVHLLVADLLWIALVLVAASILARRDASQKPVRT